MLLTGSKAFLIAYAACRERGARALEERLGLKNKATASQNSSKDVAMTQPPDIEAPAPKSEDIAE